MSVPKKRREAATFNPARRKYWALDIRDLLQARSVYHLHLTTMPNVVATAIGKYFIRQNDYDGKRAGDVRAARDRDRHHREARTLANSRVQNWSWPCVLVFVSDWLSQQEMQKHPEAVIPPFLYLEDGRVVPTCVVLAPPTVDPPERPPHLRFPENLIGGGYPVITTPQGQDRIASLGCLVTDGQATYGLTSHHAVGVPGTEVFTFLSGSRQRIGTAAPSSVGRRAFPDVYQGLDGRSTLVNLDVGLVRIESLEDWTSQVYGVGAIGSVINIVPETLSLDWIGRNLTAFGCATGRMEGRILAFFYRYRTVGGLDYVSDVLIGSRKHGAALETRPGDSGTLWFYNDAEMPHVGDAPRKMPFAVQWGGADLEGGTTGSMSFALATFLSTICRVLDVEVVANHNVGYRPFWGAVGHYTAGLKAPELVQNAKLRAFLTRNLDRISYTAEQIQQDIAKGNPDPASFVGLADVPDVVWKARVTGLPRPKDKPCHYANMDGEGAGAFEGQTLRSLCGPSGGAIELDISRWNAFYAELKKKEAGVKSGALPFRVWQLYDAMVAYLKAGKVVEFLGTAGILAHYVGDACQPLHGSQYSDGRTGEEEGVHSAYESKLLNRKAQELNGSLDAALRRVRASLAPVRTGHEAAALTVALMDRAAEILPPEEIFQAYRRDKSANSMWDALGDATARCMALGCFALASIWQGAWKAGGGARLPASALDAVSKSRLRALYKNKRFLPSMTLQEMERTGSYLA